MSIGKRIREARTAAKLTQKELAAKVGMKQASLSELETGESEGTTLVASFAAALGVSALWLESGKGSRTGGQDQPNAGGFSVQWISSAEANLLAAYRLANATERGGLDAAAAQIHHRLSGSRQEA